MGWAPARSRWISPMARCWASVRGKGRAWRKRATSSRSSWWRIPVASRSTARLRMTRMVWSRKSSSKASRLRAASLAPIDSGWWIWRMAQVRPTRSRRSRQPAGSGSTSSPARSSASVIQLPRSWVVTPAFSDWGYNGTMRPVRSPTRSTTGLASWRCAPVLGQLAEQRHLGADRKLLGPPRLVEEGAPQVGLAVEHVDVDRRLTAAGGGDPLHRGHHRRLLAHLQVPDGDLGGPVQVAPGVVGQQFEDGVDAGVGQRLALAVTDPLQAADVELAQRRQ